jgi:hypothetical protein
VTQLGPFLVLIGVAAVALAALGAAIGWYNEEGRRIRRGLRKVLQGETHALIVAPGRGRGAGFNFTTGAMAVTWDAGAWCLIYRLEELLGVELVVDGQVTGRVFRNEARRPVDVLGGANQQVSLRLVFDDPQHADFLLDLWSAARSPRRAGLDACQAVEEGNRWLARLESLFRRQPAALGGPARRPEPAAAAEPARPERARAESAAPQPRPAEPVRAERPRPAPAQAEPVLAEPVLAEPVVAETILAEPVGAEPAPLFALESEPEPEPVRRPPASRRPAAADSRQELPFDADDAPWDDDEDDQQALL